MANMKQMFTFINLNKVLGIQTQKPWYLALNDFRVNTYSDFFFNVKEYLFNIYQIKLDTNFLHHDSAMKLITKL